MTKTRIRVILFAGSTLIALIVLVFLLVLNLNQSAELKSTFLNYAVILWVFSAAAFAVFFFKGAIFSIDGELETGIITTLILTILIIVQIVFAFANYAYTRTLNSFDAFDHARNLYSSVGWDAPIDKLDSLFETLPEEIDRIYVVREDTVIRSYGSFAGNDAEHIVSGNYDSSEWYVFPVKDGRMIMHISRTYSRHLTNKILLDLSTVIVAGLFFAFELILFMMQFIKRSIARHESRELSPDGYAYIRQLAFLFYFASRMAAAFIPLLAAQLTGAVAGKSTLAASMPQSAETLFTCAAIFITSEIIIRKGWKLPFIAGLLIVAGGTLLSALAESILVFIAARAVVGLGYGFCWMTLRNLLLLGRNEEEQNHGFVLLNAGIYAGMNCGSVIGSVLAESVGYKNVFFISVLFTILCVFSILKLQNVVIRWAQNTEEKAANPSPANGNKIGFFEAAGFILLLILPACILESYTNYFVPIYAVSIGKGIADVGRAMLVYGLIIVYAAPKLSAYIRRRFGSGLLINGLYVFMLAAALILTGLWGKFGIVLLSIAIIGMGDGFGAGVQNNYFLTLPIISRLPSSRSLSWLSFLKKMAAMLGPISFALAMNFPGRTGILVMGILFMLMALFAVSKNTALTLRLKKEIN
ncbi:MAG: MFS transporter [Spirochaetaceae bacterium]|jgi:predicted MFS family arabinose efflux permease|nr:MFS transporter [Spirochaetaceae bacterium]